MARGRIPLPGTHGFRKYHLFPMAYSVPLSLSGEVDASAAKTSVTSGGNVNNNNFCSEDGGSF